MSRISDTFGGASRWCDAGRMAVVERILTTADVDTTAPDDGRVAVQARQFAVLTDGRRLPLLHDRGWGSSGRWATITADDIAATARTVVGPDEPAAGQTQEQAAADHWAELAGMLQRHGVVVDAGELRRLPHDVELGERLRSRVVESRTEGSPASD